MATARVLPRTDFAEAMFAGLMPQERQLHAAAAMGFDLLPWWRQAWTVGGDLWGIVEAGEGLLGLFVADFSGSGLEGGLGAVRVATMVELLTEDRRDPPALLGRFNCFLRSHSLPSQSVAMIYGTLDPASGRFAYAAAGMPPPLCVDPVAVAGVPPGLSCGDGRGLPLGLVEGASYPPRTLDLALGGALVLSTDGLTNAATGDGGKVGLEGLVELAGRASQIVNAVDFRHFVDASVEQLGARLEDDALFLLCRRRQDPPLHPARSVAPLLSEPISNHHVMVVEDDEAMREVIVDYMATAGIGATQVDCGERALALLEARPKAFDAVLLDKRMPGIDGFTVLRRIKTMPVHRDTPVVMLTGATSAGDMAEGISAGAFHYLTKPVDLALAVAVVKAAIADSERYRINHGEGEWSPDALLRWRGGRMNFRSIDDARSIARMLARLCPNPRRAAGGLSELLINAVEHGNLGISYADKSHHLLAGTYRQEIGKRMVLPEFADRVATISFRRRGPDLFFRISDQGRGFDCRPYLDFDPGRLTHPHGRGIAMARRLAFTDVRYCGRGNEVVARISPEGPA